MNNSKIVGMGFYVPPKVVTNNDLSKFMETSDEWITERTGIKERRYVENGVANSDLALEASKKALDQAGLTANDIDLIVFATLSPDIYFPGSGVLLQHKLGCRHIGAIDIRQQCSGFIYGLSIGDQFIKTGMYKNVLVVGSEVQSTGLDFSTRGRDMTVLFGDGAGVVILGPAEPGKGVLSTHLHSNGEHYDKLWTLSPATRKDPRVSHEDLDKGLQFPAMDGKFIFRTAIGKFVEVLDEALKANNKTIADIDLFIPHQANLRISQMVQNKLGLPDDKVFNNIMKYGNTTAATIPICMAEAQAEGKIKEGTLLAIAAFGAGLTWASALVQF